MQRSALYPNLSSSGIPIKPSISVADANGRVLYQDPSPNIPSLDVDAEIRRERSQAAASVDIPGLMQYQEEQRLRQKREYDAHPMREHEKRIKQYISRRRSYSENNNKQELELVIDYFNSELASPQASKADKHVIMNALAHLNIPVVIEKYTGASPSLRSDMRVFAEGFRSSVSRDAENRAIEVKFLTERKTFLVQILKSTRDLLERQDPLYRHREINVLQTHIQEYKQQLYDVEIYALATNSGSLIAAAAATNKKIVPPEIYEQIDQTLATPEFRHDTDYLEFIDNIGMDPDDIAYKIQKHQASISREMKKKEEESVQMRNIRLSLMQASLLADSGVFDRYALYVSFGRYVDVVYSHSAAISDSMLSYVLQPMQWMQIGDIGSTQISDVFRGYLDNPFGLYETRLAYIQRNVYSDVRKHKAIGADWEIYRGEPLSQKERIFMNIVTPTKGQTIAEPTPTQKQRIREYTTKTGFTPNKDVTSNNRYHGYDYKKSGEQGGFDISSYSAFYTLRKEYMDAVDLYIYAGRGQLNGASLNEFLSQFPEEISYSLGYKQASIQEAQIPDSGSNGWSFGGIW